MNGSPEGGGDGARNASNAAVMRRFLRLFRPYRLPLLGSAVLLLAGSLVGILYPLILRAALDDALLCGPACPRSGLLAALTAAQVCVVAVGGVLTAMQTKLSTDVGQRVMRDLRRSVYVDTKRRPLEFFTHTRFSEIQSRLLNDVRSVEMLVTNGIETTASAVVVLVSALIAMLVMSWELTLLSVAIMPLFAWLSQRAGLDGEQRWARVHEAYFEITDRAQNSLAAPAVLLGKLFATHQRDIAGFDEVNERLSRRLTRANLNGQFLRVMIGSMPALLPIGIFAVVAVQLRWGTATTGGTILAFIALQARLFDPVGRIVTRIVDVRSSGDALRGIFDYMVDDESAEGPEVDAALLPEPAVDLRDGPVPMSALELSAVNFRYPSADCPTLVDVSLQVQTGQVVAVVGPTGSGKTTIAYLVNRLYEVDSGRITLYGRDVRRFPRDELAAMIGTVTQETFLFHDTVRENLRYAKPDADDDELERAARTALVHDAILALPDGYDSLVGEAGTALSGGEKQRLAIARVILRDPQILLLDEATSALDLTSERIVQEALTSLMEGRTTVVIAHRLSTIQQADRIFVLEEGRLVEQGDHDELVSADGVYAALHREMLSGPTPHTG